MLRYALMCIAALMFVFGNHLVYAINFQPVPPFSGKFLEEVADFDSIVEPESSKYSKSSGIQTRNSIDESKEKLANQKHFNNKNGIPCSGHRNNNSSANLTLGDRSISDEDLIKRQLNRFGTVFVNKYFGSDRDVRQTEEETETESETVNNNKTSNDQQKVDLLQDNEFQKEQSQAINVTNSSKVLYEELENPPLLIEGQNQCCEEDEKNTSKNEELVTQTFGKGHFGGDFFQMQFYKQLPLNGHKVVEDDKSLLINLYPDQAKSKKELKTPAKFDYIALLTNDNKLVEVPAVKFTIVPEDNVDRDQRSYHFAPFYTSRYSKKPSLRLHSKKKHKQHVKLSSIFPTHWSHVPILFVNTIPGANSQNLNKLYKRSPDITISNNKYLREADLLIQNLKTSLRMGITDTKGKEVQGGVLVNPKFQSTDSLMSKNDKKFTKKNITEEPISTKLENENNIFNLESGFKSDVSSSLKDDLELKKDEIQPLKENTLVQDADSGELNANKNTNMIKKEIDPLEVFSSNNLKNDVNSLELNDNSLLKDKTSIESSASKDATFYTTKGYSIEVDPIKLDNLINDQKRLFDLKDTMAKSETTKDYGFNPDFHIFGIDSNKDNNYLTTVISSLNVAANKENSLSESAFDSLDKTRSEKIVKDENPEMLPKREELVSKNEASSLETKPNRKTNFDNSIESNSYKDNFLKNVLDPLESGSNNDEPLVKSIVDPIIETGLNKDNSLIKNIVNPVKDKSLIKDVSTEGYNLAKSIVNLIESNNKKSESLLEIAPGKENNLIKSEINPLEVGSYKADNLIKNEIDPIEINPNVGNDLSKDEVNPTEINSNQDGSIVESEINPLEVSPFKEENVVKNDVAQQAPGSNLNNLENSLLQGVVNSDASYSDNVIKNALNSLQQDSSLVNSYSSNIINNKVNDLSSNEIGSNSFGNAVGMVGNSGENNPKNSISKSEEMSNAYLVDLLKNVDILRNSDPKLKNLVSSDKEIENTTCETTTAESFTIPSIPDITSETKKQSHLKTTALEEESTSNVVTQASSTNDVAVSTGSNTIGRSSSSSNTTAEGATTLSPNETSLNSASSNFTAVLLSNESSTATADVSNQSKASNDSVYDDEDDVLDLLATNLTTVILTGTAETQTESSVKETTSTNHISMSMTSVPGLTVKELNSTLHIGAVSYESSVSGKSTTLSSSSGSTQLGIIDRGKSTILNKLHNLQKDLRLVFEVQNILSGSKKTEEKSKRSKRDTWKYHNQRYRRKCKNTKEKEVDHTVDPSLRIFKKIQGLGKLLAWKANEDEALNCTKKKRFLFKSKHRKKKKKKKKKKKWWKRIFGNLGEDIKKKHFLGTHPQNLL